MYPQDFLNHVNQSLRKQAEERKAVRETMEQWISRLERIQKILKEEE